MLSPLNAPAQFLGGHKDAQAATDALSFRNGGTLLPGRSPLPFAEGINSENMERLVNPVWFLLVWWRIL